MGEKYTKYKYYWSHDYFELIIIHDDMEEERVKDDQALRKRKTEIKEKINVT